jgi:pyroglutamyl-peptidase
MASVPLLFTGFEPFGGDSFNPSAALVRRLHGTTLNHGVSVQGLVLPVSGPAAWQKLGRAIRRIQPRWIVATGVSGRAELSLETTAWNEDDFRIPDNAGLQPQASAILSRGPDSLQSALAARLDPASFGTSRLPVRPSTDPGRFVCNHLYYRLLHLTRRASHPAHQRAVFLHLPASPEMKLGSDDQRFFYPLDDLGTLILQLLEKLVA